MSNRIYIYAGVSFIHERGFVHQDIKCPNILVFDTLTVKVCYFGLALQMSKEVLSSNSCEPIELCARLATVHRTPHVRTLATQTKSKIGGLAALER